MRSSHALLLAAAVLLGPAAPALADGSVLRAKGCGAKVFVGSSGIYSVLTATGGNEGIAEGDILVGRIDQIGHTLLLDRNSGRSVSALVEERNLDRAQVDQRIAVSCRSLSAAGFTRGNVERMVGCGNKMFVNTPQGYALLERLSGGTVAEGDDVSGDFNKAGRATLQVRQTGAVLTVFVDDFQLPKSAVSRKIAAICRSR